MLPAPEPIQIPRVAGRGDKQISGTGRTKREYES